MSRDPFLRQVARIYLEKEGDRLQEYCFVFPNRRSSLFFRKYLAQECSTPLFAPVLTTIGDLFISLSDLKSADDVTLLNELYQSYRRCAEGFSDTFDDFLRYGDVILGDFDDIDKYLADAAGIYRNLCDLKKLDDTDYAYLSPGQRAAIEEFWSSVRMGRKNSDTFLGSWNWLAPVYEDFRKTLTEKHIGYSGMIQRNVVSKMDEIIGSMEYSRVVFIGFNALSACEAALMDALKKAGKGDFYWDYAGPMLKIPDNRASHFMAENLGRYHSLYLLENGEDDSVPEITVVGIPSGVGQAKALPEVIEEFGGGSSLGELSTCVVLPDSSLLHPVLNSIPESVETVNVTMGYPLRESPVAFFMGLVAHLQMRTRVSGGRTGFYHVPVEGILEHPFVKKVCGEAASLMKKRIVDANLVYVHPKDAGGDPVLGRIFIPAEQKELPVYLLDVLDIIRDKASDLDREYIYHYAVCVRKLASLNLDVRVSTWFSILSRLISGVSVPLSGEPLSGLQIMGPLETMALDFRNIVILSMNEGVFPSRSVRDSMIPYNLRRGFGLPTFEVQDAIAAYHFYRSLARAEKVCFLYDTRTNGVGSSEVSRYVRQLKYHHRIPITEKMAVYPLMCQDEAADVKPVGKDAEVLKKLGGLNFSASSLLTYLKCPLQFFYSDVCGFSNPDEVVDGVDAGGFGDLYHKTMQNLHRPYEKGTIDEAAVREMNGRCHDEIRNSFREVLSVSEVSGRNLIIAELIERYVRKTLEMEMNEVPFRYLGSEITLKKDVTTPSGHVLSLKGKIDRYDCIDGTYRIVDYKTGRKIHMDYASVEELFSSEGDIPVTAFQLMFYYVLLRVCREEGSDSDILMEVVHTSELFNGGKHSIAGSPEDADAFMAGLYSLLDEIMNPGIPFSATSGTDRCEWCPFKILCGR